MDKRTCRLCGKTIGEADFSIQSKKGHVCSACLGGTASRRTDPARSGLPQSARRRQVANFALSL